MSDSAINANSTQFRAALELLAFDMEQDIQLCTTRDQHIRAVQRLAQLTELLGKLEEVTGG